MNREANSNQAAGKPTSNPAKTKEIDEELDCSPQALPAEAGSKKVLGIIGGSSFLDSKYFAYFKQLEVATVYGKVKLRCNQQHSVFFVQRHQADPASE